MVDFNINVECIVATYQNRMKFTTLKQMIKMRGWSSGTQKSHSNQRKFCWSVCTEYFFFHVSTKLFHVICQSCKYFHNLTSHQFYCSLCLFESISKWKIHHLSVHVHERKGHLKLPCSLNRQGKNCECIQHTRSSLSLCWAAIGFYFIIQLCAFVFLHLWCGSCITFPIHKEHFAKITIKVEFRGTSHLWNLVLFMYFVLKQIADRASKHYEERVCACVYQKWDR